MFSSVQSLSHVRHFVTPWIAARQASLLITISQSSFRLASIKSVMPSSHLILRHPLFLLPSIFPSIKVFPMSQLFTWGGQNTGASALASFLPKNTQDWSPILAPKRQPHEPRKVEMLLHSSTQWLNDKEYSCQWKRHSFDPWVGKIPWRRKWQSRKSHEQRSLVGYSPWGLKESDTTEWLHFHFVLQGLMVCHRASLEGGQNVGMPCLFPFLPFLGLGFLLLSPFIKGVGGCLDHLI